MEHHEPSPDDMADLLHHRATVPGLIWAALLFAACIAALLEEHAAPALPQGATAAASAPLAEVRSTAP
jgi:hypothetical protein